MSTIASQELCQFAVRNRLAGLSQPSLQAISAAQQGYSVDKGRGFLRFQGRIQRELLNHRVITDNPYTAWFCKGEQRAAQIRAFIVQFSVFSNLFLVAQLYKTINADSLDAMRASKEILANEIGVVFRAPLATRSASAGPQGTQPAMDGDPELVAAEGSVEGGVFRFRAAHFEWLLQIASRLGLGFNEVGKRRHGIPSTLFFCDELRRLYGSDDYAVSQAASYAVENWAAAGFWDELVEGFGRYNEAHAMRLPLAFFTWHSRLEAQHARHTQEELEEYYFQTALDEDAFLRYGNEMLDGVATFWGGLDEQRQSILC